MSEAMIILLFLMFFLSNQDIERKNSIFQEMVINNENSFVKCIYFFRLSQQPLGPVILFSWEVFKTFV